MSRRNFILLIIILGIISISVAIFLYFRQAPGPGEGDETGSPSDINPFGGIKNVPPKTSPPTSGGNGGTEPVGGEVQKMVLTRVSSMPIAGYTVFKKQKTEKEFVSALRYAERAMGFIYQTYAAEIKESKFSNTTIPQIYEALFGNNGETVIMRYAKEGDTTIYTFKGNLPKEKIGEELTGAEIRGSALTENITDLSLSPDTTKIFYLFNTGENAFGTIMNLKDNTKTQIFTSPFTEWLSAWPSSKMITLNTKPSGNIGGHLYSINTDRKNLSRVFGDIAGLTTLTSRDGKLVLYSGSNLSLNLYHIDTKETEPLGLNTLPEKCVWADSYILYCAVPKSVAPNIYPDAWYKGEVSFSDEIWKIDAENKNTTRIMDPGLTAGEEIDGVKLSLDEKGDYLFFVNKKDSHLWELRFK